MDIPRILLLGAMAVIGYLLILEWSDFKDAQKPAPIVQTQALNATTTTSNDNSVPTLTNTNSDVPTINTTTVTPNSTGSSTEAAAISVETDVFKTTISLQGGDITSVALKQHKTSLDNPTPLQLLDQNNYFTYIAQSGLIGANGTDTGSDRPAFNSAQTNYQLSDGQDELTVDLSLPTENGVTITKRYRFKRDNYFIELEYLINNQSTTDWQAALFGQIKRDSSKPSKEGGGLGVSPYLGAAFNTAEDLYKKVDFGDINKQGFTGSNTGGWAALIQHYFLSAWVPNKEQANQFSARKLNNNLYAIGFTSPLISVPAGSKGELTAGFYAGPKDQYRLAAIAKDLDRAVDYGFLWFISEPLYWLLDKIHSYVGNWGWSIILLTVLIKLLFFYPSAVSYRSMAKMRKLTPKMQNLRDLYANDRQKLSQEMMQLYKKEKVNPMGGCLPILIQMPVFIALYWVLLESVGLRHAPFLGWIQDLSIKDPLFILPLIMGATMFIQQKLNPTPPDPMQAKVMAFMPVMFTVLFLWFPAGLVLYWVTNNILSIIQQYVITRQIERA